MRVCSKSGDIETDLARKHVALDIGNHPFGEAREHCVLFEGRRRPDRDDQDNRKRQHEQQMRVFWRKMPLIIGPTSQSQAMSPFIAAATIMQRTAMARTVLRRTR